MSFHPTTRRVFIQVLPAAGALVLGGRALAQGAVDEKEPLAAGLGFVTDAGRADKAKYKSYAAGQQCSACALFQGGAGAASGACSMFAGRTVPAKGWCSAFSKKP